MGTLNVSFEFFTPKDETAAPGFWQAVERLDALAPGFFSLTCGAGGSDRERSDRTVRAMNRRIDSPVAAHITCAGFPRSEVDRTVTGWRDIGVRRIVALRGDMPGMQGPFRPHPDGYRNAADLVAGLVRMGGFDISVGCYPECHPDSPSVEADIDNLKRKVDAGADRAITQYFFDAEVFLRFRDRARAAGIAVPLVVGVMPIHHFGRLRNFSQRCGASIPGWLAERFDGLDDDPETRDLLAATTAAELCQRLRAEGVDDFHFYTLNKAHLVFAVARILGVKPALEQAA